VCYVSKCDRSLDNEKALAHSDRLTNLRHAAITDVPISFISLSRTASLICEERVYISAHLTPYRLYMNYRCNQITLQWSTFHTNYSGAKC
jgi:hypothetical protein